MRTAEGILNKFNSIKTLPHVAIRLSKLISDDNSRMQEFEEVIKLDPTMVLRLLRLANSPYYGLREKIDSIPRAVVHSGTQYEISYEFEVASQIRKSEYHIGDTEFLEWWLQQPNFYLVK